MDNIQNSIQQQIFKRKCPKHPLFYCDMLLLDPNSEQHRACSECMMEIEFSKKVILIQDLFSLDPSSMKPIYPLIDNDELSGMINSQNNIEQIFSEIEEYYFKLQANIQEAIKKLISKDLEFTRQQIFEWQASNKKLSNLLSIQTFQELLLSQENDSEKDLHEYIVKRNTQAEKEMQEIKTVFSKFKEFSTTFSTEQPLIIQTEIMKQLQKIDLFPSNNAQFKDLFARQVKTKCIPSQSFDYSDYYLKIKKINNQIIIENTTSFFGYKQCYLLPELHTKMKYIIQLSLINECNEEYEEPRCFCFGLLNFELKDNECIADQKVYYEDFDGGNCTKIVKGNKLHSSQRCGNKQLEFRIHIQQQIFKVSSFPDYSDVAELEEKNDINVNESYLFAIAINNPSDCVKIHQILEVESFDTSMD